MKSCMESLKQCLLIHALRRRLHCYCMLLFAKLVLSFPVMAMCKPVVWGPLRRVCLPPPADNMEGRNVMCDLLAEVAPPIRFRHLGE